MDIVKNKTECSGCHACYSACPVHAITMEPDKEGFLYPKISLEKCIHCGKCRNVCSQTSKLYKEKESISYAGYMLDLGTRMQSSSGGIFSALSQLVLAQGGIVCGAAFDNEMKVRHIMIDSPEELWKLKGSKYVQSTIGDIFQKILENLKQGRWVLFSGTACQVAGLKAFLKQDYPRLLCIDLICHGVPSPEVFQRYLQELSPDKKIVSMTFRDKTQGIGNVQLVYKRADGSVIREEYAESPYIYGFINNLYLRPSCYECRNKGIERCSDITLGDFWGIEKKYPDFGDKFGISAVIVHTDQGQKWIDAMPNMKIMKVETRDIVENNPCLVQSVYYEKSREYFFSLWKKNTLKNTISAIRTRNFKIREIAQILIYKAQCLLHKM